MVSVFKEAIPIETFDILLKSAQLFLDNDAKKALDELLIIDDPHILKGISVKLLIANLLNDNTENVKILISNAKKFSNFIIKKIMLELYFSNNIDFINIMQKICKNNDNNDIYLTALLLDSKYKEAMLFYQKIYQQPKLSEKKVSEWKKFITLIKPSFMNKNKFDSNTTLNIKHEINKYEINKSDTNIEYEMEESTADNINSYRIKYEIKDEIINIDILLIYILIFNNIKKYKNIDEIIKIFKINKFVLSCLTIDIFEELFYKLVKTLLYDKEYKYFILLMKEKYNENYYNEKYELLIKEYFDLTGVKGFDKSKWGLKYSKLCLNNDIAKYYNPYSSYKIK